MSEQWNPAENDAPEGEVRRGRGEGRGFGPCGRGHHLHGRHFHGPHSDGPHSDELHPDGPHSGGRHSDGLRARHGGPAGHWGFRRRFATREEQRSALEGYLSELRAEAQAVEERIAALKQDE